MIIMTSHKKVMMTCRELTSGFDFWSAGHLRMAMVHLPINFGVSSLSVSVSVSSPELLTFSEIQDGGCRQLGFSVFYEFGHSGVLIVWNLCCVSNLVQISVIVTEMTSRELTSMCS